MSGQKLFAVSVFPDESTVVPGLEIILSAFMQRNTERLLRDPRNNIGTWYIWILTYLDVSTTLPDREIALALAVQCNQIAIYDLARQEEMPTFGTGEDNHVLHAGEANVFLLLIWFAGAKTMETSQVVTRLRRLQYSAMSRRQSWLVSALSGSTAWCGISH